MENLIKDIKQLIGELLKMDTDLTFSDKTLDSGIKISRAIKCYKNNKEGSYYVTRFNSFDFDKRDFIRMIIEIPCQDNVRSKNIEIIMDVLKKLESYFTYIDYVRLRYGDGLIHLDTYRENTFKKSSHE